MGTGEKKCLPCEHADPSSIPVSHSGRREFSPENCPLISTCVTMAQTQTSHQTDSSSNNSNNYHDEVLKCVKEIWWGKRTYLHSFGKQNPEAMRSWPRAEGQVPETILTAPSCGWHPPHPTSQAAGCIYRGTVERTPSLLVALYRVPDPTLVQLTSLQETGLGVTEPT